MVDKKFFQWMEHLKLQVDVECLSCCTQGQKQKKLEACFGVYCTEIAPKTAPNG